MIVLGADIHKGSHTVAGVAAATGEVVGDKTVVSAVRDGGGTHFVVDCREPERPSMVRDCFREDFTGPDWGKPLAPLASWLANATELMTSQSWRFDPERETWLPREAVHAYWPHFDTTKPPNLPIHGAPA